LHDATAATLESFLVPSRIPGLVGRHAKEDLPQVIPIVKFRELSFLDRTNEPIER